MFTELMASGSGGGSGVVEVINSHTSTPVTASTIETINITKSGLLKIQIDDMNADYTSTLKKNGTQITYKTAIDFTGHFQFHKYYEVDVANGDVITIQGGNGYRWIFGIIE